MFFLQGFKTIPGEENLNNCPTNFVYAVGRAILRNGLKNLPAVAIGK